MAISASIQALIAGETVAGSRISNRLLTELIQEGLLQIIIHGSRKSYRANNIEALKRFLIDKDENYRILNVNKGSSSMSTYINTAFHKRYCSSHAIHNQLISENGWHLIPIYISTLATLIWLVFIYSYLSFRSI